MIPTKKISQTLIDYAEPLINDLQEHHTQSDLEGILHLAAGIWNACVMDKWKGNTENVDAVRRLMAMEAHPIPVAIVEALIVRKQQYFGSDLRGITNECVIVREGQFSVRAEARGDPQNVAATSS